MTELKAPDEAFERVPATVDGHQPATSPSDPAAPGRAWYKRPAPLAIVLILGVVALAGGARYLHHALTHESTDDAFIEAHIVAISPKVASDVAGVHVDDNQHVNRGDLLVELDPRDFEARLAQARSNLAAAVARHHAAAIKVRVVETTSEAGVDQAAAGVETARRQVDGARSRLEQARAQVAAAGAEAARAEADVQRYEQLLGSGAVSRQERDNAVATNRTASANLDAARKAEQAAADGSRQTEAQLAQAQARLTSARAAPDQIAYSRAETDQAAADIARFQAEAHQAELALSYTKIYAPEAGRITRKSVEPDAYASVGQTLFSIVPDRVPFAASTIG